MEQPKEPQMFGAGAASPTEPTATAVNQATAKENAPTAAQVKTQEQTPATAKTTPQSPANQATAVAKVTQTDLVSTVLDRINELQDAGDLKLPANYAAGNQLKLAWLNLTEVTNRDGKPALECCTKESIANALMEMCVQGLSVMKKQCDFIVYGNKLTLQLEYHGTVALAKRYGGVTETPVANCIYEGDDFVYEINPATGRRRIVKHTQDYKSIDMNKIIGAYAIIQLEGGQTHVEIMSMPQIKQAWMQGATKGQSPAHKNFPDQMAMKTVIGRACKLFISTSDDAGLFEGKGEEAQAEAKQPTKTLNIEEGNAEALN